MKTTLKTVLGVGLVAFAQGGIAQQESSLQLDTDAITVSGLSSGGFMATQFHLANSDKVSGAAMLRSSPGIWKLDDYLSAEQARAATLPPARG